MQAANSHVTVCSLEGVDLIAVGFDKQAAACCCLCPMLLLGLTGPISPSLLATAAGGS